MNINEIMSEGGEKVIWSVRVYTDLLVIYQESGTYFGP